MYTIFRAITTSTFPPPLMSAFQSRFNAKNLILFHSAYTNIGIHLCSIAIYSAISSWIHYIYLCFFDCFLLACSYTISYIVRLDTAFTKIQVLTHSTNAGGMSIIIIIIIFNHNLRVQVANTSAKNKCYHWEGADMVRETATPTSIPFLMDEILVVPLFFQP